MTPLASKRLGVSRAAILAALFLRPELKLHAPKLARVTGVLIGTSLPAARFEAKRWHVVHD